MRHGSRASRPLIPSYGGAFLAGSTVVAVNLSPQTLIVGCEPVGSGVDLRLSRQTQFRSNRIDTSDASVADGLRSNVFPCVCVYGNEQDDIRKSVRLFIEDMKMVVERRDAVP
ncbi:hypothetical protein CFAM422_009654 [Trichoderma lentiforme]|uniref:Uncharacterized protein n=1 Tax=Trichoderma lentiforme TaxID=1567552 RepID=A0A9P5C8L8_9HYPO|nr:hypothetical protein CFAM422_009654 [Trichoderma lentiforme]